LDPGGFPQGINNFKNNSEGTKDIRRIRKRIASKFDIYTVLTNINQKDVP
jgi:hypothetical protein